MGLHISPKKRTRAFLVSLFLCDFLRGELCLMKWNSWWYFDIKQHLWWEGKKWCFLFFLSVIGEITLNFNTWNSKTLRVKQKQTQNTLKKTTNTPNPANASHLPGSSWLKASRGLTSGMSEPICQAMLLLKSRSKMTLHASLRGILSTVKLREQIKL